MKSASLVLTLPLGSSLKFAFNRRSLYVSMFGIVVSLLVIFVLQVNAYTKEMYLLQDYQQKIGQLSEENKYLEIDFAKADSLENIGGFVQNMTFEKADNIEYIKLLDATVLAK